MILIPVAFVVYASWSKYTCLNGNPGFAVGVVINIRGRETINPEYAKYIYEINQGDHKKTYRNSTMIRYSSVVTRESVVKDRKFIVVYCRKKPRVSRIILDLPTSLELGDKVDSSRFDKSIIKTEFLDL